MKIYNTLTRKKEEFVPVNPGKVGIYVCGPTVYDYIHIGNARPMIAFDTLRRYLLYKGYEVNYVSNFTDVDDKIINRANEEGLDASLISEKYIAECRKDMEALNVMPATVHPQATKEISDMIELVDTLIRKNHAYEKNGTVYFRTRSFKDYGKLSHKNIDELESGHRAESHALKVDGADEKEDGLDFVLWKPKKPGEPAWISPWGEGRPGWHLECSCMSKKYVGGTLDIHAGGEDLIFPHHENEIAQSEAANDAEFARYWMHNGFLRIDNEKMSKSLGNFKTVREITEQYDPQVVRFFMLSVHYRGPLNFSRELVEAAGNGLSRILTCAEKLRDIKKLKAGSEGGEDIDAVSQDLGRFRTQFEDAMDDDLNTADAITAIFEMVKYININIDASAPAAAVDECYKELSELCGILGIIIEEKEDALGEEIERMIKERQEARKNKDFAKADEIRDRLLEMGIELKDTREGVKWKRI